MDEIMILSDASVERNKAMYPETDSKGKPKARPKAKNLEEVFNDTEYTKVIETVG